MAVVVLTGSWLRVVMRIGLFGKSDMFGNVVAVLASMAAQHLDAALPSS